MPDDDKKNRKSKLRRDRQNTRSKAGKRAGKTQMKRARTDDGMAPRQGDSERTTPTVEQIQTLMSRAAEMSPPAEPAMAMRGQPTTAATGSPASPALSGIGGYAEPQQPQQPAPAPAQGVAQPMPQQAAPAQTAPAPTAAQPQPTPQQPLMPWQDPNLSQPQQSMTQQPQPAMPWQGQPLQAGQVPMMSAARAAPQQPQAAPLMPMQVPMQTAASVAPQPVAPQQQAAQPPGAGGASGLTRAQQAESATAESLARSQYVDPEGTGNIEQTVRVIDRLEDPQQKASALRNLRANIGEDRFQALGYQDKLEAAQAGLSEQEYARRQMVLSHQQAQRQQQQQQAQGEQNLERFKSQMGVLEQYLPEAVRAEVDRAIAKMETDAQRDVAETEAGAQRDVAGTEAEASRDVAKTRKEGDVAAARSDRDMLRAGGKAAEPGQSLSETLDSVEQRQQQWLMGQIQSDARRLINDLPATDPDFGDISGKAWGDLTSQQKNKLLKKAAEARGFSFDLNR